MVEVVRVLDQIIVLLRAGFGGALVAAAALAAVAWGVRTRRINAFGAPARLSRDFLDPLIAPVERRIVRFGGTHTSAPWWALLALLVFGAIALGLLGFLRNALVSVAFASSQGTPGLFRLAIATVFAVLQLALIARVVMSWVGGTYSAPGRLAILLTEWGLRPLRRVLPTVGMFDISPLVAYFTLSLVRGLVL
jgi:YggT family protein